MRSNLIAKEAYYDNARFPTTLQIRHVFQLYHIHLVALSRLTHPG